MEQEQWAPPLILRSVPVVLASWFRKTSGGRNVGQDVRLSNQLIEKKLSSLKFNEKAGRGRTVVPIKAVAGRTKNRRWSVKLWFVVRTQS